MTKKELYQILKCPEKITSDHITGLEQLISFYPYNGSLILLYLYALAKVDDARFSAILKHYIAYIPHRDKLFEMIFGLYPRQAEEQSKSINNDNFSLIDNFLEDVRLSGEDLPQELNYRSDLDEYLSRPDVISRMADNHQLDCPDTTTVIDPAQANRGSTATPTTDTELFTETLARIYISQGKYDRALAIIRSLYLHYPNKNRYFADQISFLERLLNNSNN